MSAEKPRNVAPLYVMMWERAVEIGRQKGYAIAIHGSLNRDLDLVAIPWTEEAVSAEELVASLADELAWQFESVKAHVLEPTDKPHGRRAWAFPFMKDWAIDLSVMPRRPIPSSPDDGGGKP